MARPPARRGRGGGAATAPARLRALCSRARLLARAALMVSFVWGRRPPVCRARGGGLAGREGHIDIVRLLLRKGADVGAVNMAGLTARQVAPR